MIVYIIPPKEQIKLRWIIKSVQGHPETAFDYVRPS